MNIRSKDRLIDKSIDVAVVIIGILIALSINSYKQSSDERGQWSSFSKKVKVDTDKYKNQYAELIDGYKKRSEQLSQLKNQLEVSKVDKEFIQVSNIK